LSHAFPRSASHGLRRWELDVSAWVIAALRRAGLAWNVIEISPERQETKLDRASPGRDRLFAQGGLPGL
jgi:stearoyl-CoA desaturase (delta-9 desaturase)